MARASLNRLSSGHSLMPRGLGFGSIEGTKSGRFDRLIPSSQAARPDDEMLWKLAQFMTKSFDDQGPSAPDPGLTIEKAEPADENPTIPAAYTYFGQFVDHDLTLDTTDFGQSQKDVSATVDFRTPALDLDCLYGAGPADQPYLYTLATNGERHLLRLGAATGGTAQVCTKADLLRLPPEHGNGPALAVIGDKRNDENKIVSQLQAVMISFHNRVYEDDAFHVGIADMSERFANAVRIVRWHYQWIVLNDFLDGHLVPKGALSDFGSIHHPLLPRYDAAMVGRDYPFMPVEFSGAAYRLGHSMVRPSYSLSAATLTTADKAPPEHRVPTFGTAGSDLRGFGEAIDKQWSIDWGFFAEDVAPTAAKPGWVLPQPSYRIDTRIGHPLAALPEFEALAGDAVKARQMNLAYRNLSRGVGLALPTGEEAAGALRIEPLTTEQVWSAGSNLYRDEPGGSEIKSRRQAIANEKFAEHFKGRTPLWYYILREAEWYGCTRTLPPAYAQTPSLHGESAASVAQENTNFGGQFLGPVGTHIVLETFLGVLWHDPASFLHQPTWTPDPRIAGAGRFSLGKLIAYALG